MLREIEEAIRKILADRPELMGTLSFMKRRFVQEHMQKRVRKRQGAGANPPRNSKPAFYAIYS